MRNPKLNKIQKEINQHQISDMLKMYLNNRIVSGNNDDNNEEFSTVCPFCHSEIGKFWMSNEKNSFYCFACGKKGDIIDIVKYLLNVNMAAAMLDIDNRLHHTNLKKINIKQREATVKAKEKRAGSIITDLAYRIFLKAVSLSQSDNQYLLQTRHLTPAQIKQYHFFTMPENTQEFRENLYNVTNHNGYTLRIFEHVPGFYCDKKPLPLTMFNSTDHQNNRVFPIHIADQVGLGIPVKDANGMIIGIQIRSRLPHPKVRYTWLTSSKQSDLGGASVKPKSQLFLKNSSTVCLTEGFFKGLAISEHFNATTIALPGVGINKDVEEQIKIIQLIQSSKIKEIKFFFDADLSKNLAVLTQLIKLQKRLYHTLSGVKLTTVIWKLNLGKGFDDLLFNLKHGESLTINDYKQLTINQFGLGIKTLLKRLQPKDYAVNKQGVQSRVKLVDNHLFNEIFF